MSCEGKIYVGQIGVLFEVDTQGVGCPVVNWASSTLREIIMLRPDRTEVKFVATLQGTLLNYLTTHEDNLPLEGDYKVQAHVVGPGYDALGETDTFTVYDKWK